MMCGGSPTENRKLKTENPIVIDAHVHCGVQNVPWGWERLKPLLKAAGIAGAGVIPPVEDIYDRYDYNFQDNSQWQAHRRRAHQYLLNLQAAEPEIAIHPYFFVWNDFAWEDLGPEYVAIKWHRHPDEPEYHYDAPRCREFLQAVKARGMPILLEESFHNTLFFIEKLAPDFPIIIPHLGALNGGYRPLRQAGVFGLPHIYADTALAAWPDLEDYLGRYGSTRLMFGSDFPFSQPQTELDKVRRLNLPETEQTAVLGGNFTRLCGMSANGASQP
jgi:hypothetical protein